MLRKLFLSLILAVIVTAGLPAVSYASAASANYIAELTVDPKVLEGVATDVQKRFAFSSAAEFENVYTFKSKLSLEQLRQQLAGSFEYLNLEQELSVGSIDSSRNPDDPFFTTNPENIDKQWGLVKAEFITAWETATGSDSVVVAIVDTGIDQTHDDLKSAKFATGFNVFSGTTLSRYRNSDDNGHGTLMTGIIGATSNNHRGIAGALRDVTLMPIKALNSKGSGSSAQISEGIVWAADHGADVINLSLGGNGLSHDNTLADAITYAFERDVVIVAAAGNDVAVTGGNLDIDPVFPICDDNGKNMVIGVTATDVNDLKPNFANYGKACIDVSAPGRRIVSTINHDPATGAAKADVYAYASGTSLAVPFVTAQAALLKSLFPFASNRQIRDRIISTVDNIDNLNLSQCAGGSCKGLLGGGRINVAKSIEEQILSLEDGELVERTSTGQIYYINGGKRQYVTPFVLNQRFAGVPRKQVTSIDLEKFPEGSYAEPLEGTLVKIPETSTVYYIEQGLRRPVTGQVFQLRKFNFNNVHTLSSTEVFSWIEGSFLTPPEGTLVRTAKSLTVYWTVGGVLHPINEKFWIDRGLNIFPVIFVPDSDLNKYPIGDAYIL